MVSTSSAITTAWTPPDEITGLSATVVEEFSHIQLDWDPTTLSAMDFHSYRVQRREDGGPWLTLDNIGTSTITQYKDALTGQGVTYEYRVQQLKNIPGDAPLISETGDIVTATLESDLWFVIGNEDPDDEDHSFELPVASESHTRPIQQEVFEPIVGIRKKVARGNVLGYEGTLQLIWQSSERAEARVYLDFLASNFGPHILKSPFGDVWRVEFDAPDYSYSGGGHLSVEIGWVEVI